MYTLRIPSAEFATSALAASAKAGYLGAVLLLARRLDSTTETELRDFWEDLNDITGSELLILVPGLRTEGNRNTIRSYRLQRDLFADGVAIARCYKEGFEEGFDALLSAATPTPETPPKESSRQRLISAEGITEIRRGLHISERDLPVILIRSNREDREMLLRLGDERCVMPPVLVISEIVTHLEDVPHRINMLRSILDSINADYSRIQDNISRQSNYATLLSRVEKKSRGRSQHRVALAGRMERALQNAPDEIREAGTFVLEFIVKPNGIAEESVRAIGKIANYLETPEGRFIAILKKGVAEAQKRKRWKYESDDELLSIKRKCKDELSRLGQIDESTWQKKVQLEGQRSEISASLSKPLPLREAHFSVTVAKALEGLGFVLERNADTLSNRNTFVRSAGLQSIVRHSSSPVAECDSFLSHNSADKPAVRTIADELTARALKVWYDEWQLRPGLPWQPLLEAGLRASKAAAALVGKEGLGPWASEEVHAALRIAVKAKLPVIPILLPGAPPEPELPAFLGNRTWVDLRSGLTAEAFKRIIWGVAGRKDSNS